MLTCMGCCMEWYLSLYLKFFYQFVFPCGHKCDIATLHHPYICACFCGKHFYDPCFCTFYGVQAAHGQVQFFLEALQANTWLHLAKTQFKSNHKFRQ